MAEMDDRKKRIMEHLARTKGEFLQRPTSNLNNDRKQQIRDHVRRTSG